MWHKVLKCISAILIFTFLYQQTVWSRPEIIDSLRIKAFWDRRAEGQRPHEDAAHVSQTLKSLVTLIMETLGIEDIEDELLLDDTTRSTNTFRLYREREVFTEGFVGYLNSVPPGEVILTIQSTQSEAQRFKVVAGKKQILPSAEGISANEAVLWTIDVPNSDMALQVKAVRRQKAQDVLFTDFREQLKFVTTINALTNLDGDAGFSLFARHLGEDNAERFFHAIKNIRRFYKEKFGGKVNDKIIVNESGEPSFGVFAEQLKEELKLHTIQDAEQEIYRLQKAVDKFIDQNDLLVELINLMVEKGLWTYDAGTKVLFLEQVNVGVVDGRVVDAVRKVKQVEVDNYLFGFQANPERQNRAATGRLQKGETFLYWKFIKRGLPLERWLPFKRDGSRFEYYLSYRNISNYRY